MSNEGTYPQRPWESPKPRPWFGVAMGRFHVPCVDEPEPPYERGKFHVVAVSASERESRRLSIAVAEASVRLSGSMLPLELEEVNRRFVDAEISAEEHLAMVVRLAAAFAGMASVSPRPGPVLGAQVGDAMLRAVREVCDGRAERPQQVRHDFQIPEHLQQLAVSVFGSEDGRRWWTEPAFGLGWQLPIDVLAQTDGVEIVEGLLRRIEAYVYT